METMGLSVVELLSLPAWQAFDVDDQGRVLAGHNGSGSVQLVELAVDGTATPLTALPGPCRGRYLPGERGVVVVHDEGGNERSQLSLLRLDPRPPLEPVTVDGLEPLVRDGRFIHNLLEVGPGRVVYATNRRNGVDFDVIVRSTVDGTESVVYDDGGLISGLSLAPGRTDVAVTRATALPMSQQLLVSSGGREGSSRTRELSPATEPAQHLGPQWRPDGAALIVASNLGREFTAVFRVDPDTGERTELVADPEHDLVGYLSPDGRVMLVAANVDGAARLALHDAATGERLRGIDLPGEGWTEVPVWSPDSSRIVLTFTAPSVPGDVLCVDVATGGVSTVADSTGPLGGASLIEPSLHLVPAHDGEQIPCFVYQGAGGGRADASLAGSAVLVIHGGPEGQSVRAFHPIVQALASAGHTVLVPNVRGSDGYGKRWYSLDDVRLRLDSVADLASLHAYLPELGVDRSRAALFGGSYGGYMVLAGVAFQPALWAAGVDVVGISSLVTFLENTSPYRRAAREREYGSLEHDREFLAQASPLSRIDDVRAPLFVIHGANDPRVPLSEAEQLCAALEANGVECELHVYADEGHGLARRTNRLDAYPKALEFFARHLRRPAPAE
jgi:dipeptidyl aminopeptidase/acylaminoacyl peptidase